MEERKEGRRKRKKKKMKGRKVEKKKEKKEELNIKSVIPCNDPLKYASLRAKPDYRYVMDSLIILALSMICYFI